MENQGEIIIYRPDEDVKSEVGLENGTVFPEIKRVRGYQPLNSGYFQTNLKNYLSLLMTGETGLPLI